jgi:hypothetical protein
MQQVTHVCSGRDVARRRCPLEQPGPGHTTYDGSRAGDREPGAFLQAKDRDIVVFQELGDAQIASLTQVPTDELLSWIVRIDLKRDEPRAASVGGSTIGMSLVVRIVGHATLVPALEPM